MNLVTRRASAFAIACGLVAATVAGCSAGQQSQTATQLPAVNGTSGGVQYIALRDVQLQVDQTGPAVPEGKSVALVFVATNQSPDKNDKIARITSPVGTVKLGGKSEIPALKSLIVGPSEGGSAAPQSAPGANAGTATVQLSEPISSGLTYDFTFEFQHAGRATLAVPVTASVTAPRVDQAPPHGDGH